MKKILLPRLADDRGRIDGVLAMRHPVDGENRVVVGQRVVTVVVAERPLGPPDARRHRAQQCELRAADQAMGAAAAHYRQPIAGKQRRQHQLGHVLRKRRDGGQHQRGRTAEKYGGGQCLVPCFGRGVVESASLADLPVHAGRPGIVHLQPVHAEVVPGARRVLGVDERQRDERPAVLGPAGKGRQPVEPDVAGDNLGYRPPGPRSRADAEQRAGHVARAPQFRGRRREQRLGQLHQPPDELQRARAEGELRPARGTEQVGDERKRRTGDVREEQRRAAGGDDPAVDLRRFERGIDGNLDNREVAVTFQPIDERTEVGKTGARHEHVVDDTSPGTPVDRHPRSACW